MGYLIRVWCRDCSGDNDEQGCFGGGSEVRGSEWDGLRPVPFATFAEAEAFGHKFTSGPPWEFEVTNLEGEQVES